MREIDSLSALFEAYKFNGLCKRKTIKKLKINGYHRFFLDSFSIHCVHAPNKASSIISAYFEEYRLLK